MPRIPRPERVDVPQTTRELYPFARRRERVQLRSPGRVSILEYFRTSIILTLAIGGFALIFVLVLIMQIFGLDGEAALAAFKATPLVFAAAALAKALGMLLAGRRSDPWAERRGMRALHGPIEELSPLLARNMCRHQRDPRTWGAIVGERRVPVRLSALRLRWNRDVDVYAYIAELRLPPGAADRFPSSRFERRSRSTPIDWMPGKGCAHELESERLVRRYSLLVDGGTPLDWKQLFDPALVDLLASEIDVEWYQCGDDLLLLMPVGGRDLTRIDASAMDTLCVAAVAIERRVATMLGSGRAIAPAEPLRGVPGPPDPRGRIKHYLSTERARDLEMGPGELLDELARYTSAEEVASVQAKIDAGAFPLSMLDDLVHHRRAAFWGDQQSAA